MKTKISTVALFVTIALMFFGGVQVRSVAAARIEPHPGFQRVGLAQSANIIQDALMAKGITGSTMRDIQPVDVTSTFPLTQLKIYCVVAIQDAPRGTVLGAKWIAVSVNNIDPETQFAELEFTDVEGSGNLAFSVTNNNRPFPEGKYRVDVYLNSELDGNITFSVSSVASSASSSSSSGASSGTSAVEFVSRIAREPDPKIPASVAVDKQGNLYIGELGQVRKIDANGKFVLKFGAMGEKDGNINSPNGIALDSQGNILVVDTLANHVQKFDATGKWLMTLGKKGASFIDNASDADGEFFQPLSVAVDSAGNIYVSDSGNNRIQKFDATGKFLLKWGGAMGFGDGQLATPAGIAVDVRGNIYVCDARNDRIQKFDSDGKFLSKFGKGGSGNGEFNTPYAIALDVQGNIFVISKSGAYVPDPSEARVQKFDRNGSYVMQFGGKGKDDGLFGEPSGVAVDTQGNIYVADLGNQTVQKFRDPSQSSSVFTTLPPGSSSSSSTSAQRPPIVLSAPPAPSAPPGVYATSIQVVQNPPKRGQFVTFKVAFFNTTDSLQNYEWLVKPYTPDLKSAKGETYRKKETIPVGASEFTSAEGWRITGGGGCETYVARVFWADPANKSNHIEFPKPDKSGGPTVQFQVCP